MVLSDRGLTGYRQRIIPLLPANGSTSHCGGSGSGSRGLEGRGSGSGGSGSRGSEGGGSPGGGGSGSRGSEGGGSGRGGMGDGLGEEAPGSSGSLEIWVLLVGFGGAGTADWIGSPDGRMSPPIG